MPTTDEALKEAREVIKEQKEVLERLAQAPLQHASIVRIGKKRCTVTKGGDLTECLNPEFEIALGDSVLLDPNGGQILEKTASLALGEPVTILRIVDKERAEVSINGSNKLIFMGVHTVKEGDEVLLNSSGHVIVSAVKFAKPRFAVTQTTGVTWDSIGGQEEAKEAFREAIELPFKSPEIFKAYNKQPMKGVLLSGPPGCGKTMLGKAAATAIQKMTGAKESGFLYIKGPEILDPYVGVAEAAVRKIFLRAREHKANTGSPAVVFIDEADAILGKRGGHHSFMEKTIVPAFLTEMDGMEESGALIILATNRPDTLDPAVIRDGRIDRKIAVTRPTLDDSADIFRLYLKDVPLAKSENAKELGDRAANSLFSLDRALYHVTLASQKEIVVPLSALVRRSYPRHRRQGIFSCPAPRYSRGRP